MPKNKPRRIEVWGLTGGIASGKSTVARIFNEMGIAIIDADQIARDLSQPGGGAYDLIVKRFGVIDRSALRKIVFSDPAARRDLEAILHPLIQAESVKRMQLLAQATPERTPERILPVIYEATLLVETGRYKDFDGLMVVEAPRADRVERVTARDKISAELANQIIDSQASDSERRAVAQAVFDNSGDNSGDLEALRRQVAGFIDKWGWKV